MRRKIRGKGKRKERLARILTALPMPRIIERRMTN